jgi:hypothetical protein
VSTGYQYQHDQDCKADQIDDRIAIRIFTTPEGGTDQHEKQPAPSRAGNGSTLTEARFMLEGVDAHEHTEGLQTTGS